VREHSGTRASVVVDLKCAPKAWITSGGRTRTSSCR
jgi:hypothetical protein